MMSKKKSEIEIALNNAFDVCLLVEDTTDNILASDGENALKTDIEINKKAKQYISWYKKTFNKK